MHDNEGIGSSKILKPIIKSRAAIMYLEKLSILCCCAVCDGIWNLCNFFSSADSKSELVASNLFAILGKQNENDAVQLLE